MNTLPTDRSAQQRRQYAGDGDRRSEHQAIRDEQQRLGQDLHDNLSASIVSIKHQLEALTIDAEDSYLKSKLEVLQKELMSAYETARNKSHEWFYAAEKQQEQSFEQQIKTLTDSALPDSRYTKNILIDDGSLQHIHMDARITLLRVVQEAITNIIKHAKAKTVHILVYEEANNLILTIKDDGKGMGDAIQNHSRSNIGLQSVRRRVQYLNGDMEIHSDTAGTELTITVPQQLTIKPL